MSPFTYEFKYQMPATPEQVFAALTDPARLKRWFTQHSEVEPREGGAFRFWGNHTYETYKKADATQRLRRFDPPKGFTFNWTLHGKDSEVDFFVEPKTGDEKHQAEFGVRHKFADLPKVTRAKELVEDFWRMQVGNLYLHLMGRDPTLIDFTDPRPEVVVSIVIEAPRERVFKALLDPETLNKWISSAAEVEPRKGGRYVYGWSYKIGDKDVKGGPTKIIDMVENEKLVTDWPDWRGDESMPLQTITWTLESVGTNATKVTLTHSGFTRASDIGDYGLGWGGFLEQLKEALA